MCIAVVEKSKFFFGIDPKGAGLKKASTKAVFMMFESNIQQAPG